MFSFNKARVRFSDFCRPAGVSKALILASVMTGVMVSVGESKAQTQCFTFSPVASLVPNCVNGDWTNVYESFQAIGQGGSGRVTDVAVTPDQGQVSIEFDPLSPGGTSGYYNYSIVSSHGNIHLAKLGANDAIGSIWSVTKKIYSDPARLNLVQTLNINQVSPMALSGPLNYSQLWITNEWSTTTVGMKNILNTYQTPGPLPVLGAGAALGFSRKLRGRIKASRAV